MSMLPYALIVSHHFRQSIPYQANLLFNPSAHCFIAPLSLNSFHCHPHRPVHDRHGHQLRPRQTLQSHRPEPYPAPQCLQPRPSSANSCFSPSTNSRTNSILATIMNSGKKWTWTPSLSLIRLPSPSASSNPQIASRLFALVRERLPARAKILREAQRNLATLSLHCAARFGKVE